MSLIEGKYKHYKNENIDEYFAAVGVPYMVRKMISLSSPTMEFKKEGDKWIMTTIAMMKTTVQQFNLNEEYDEEMPDATLKSLARLEGENELVIDSSVPGTDDKTARRYTFTEEEMMVTLTHSKAKNASKRYFRRIKNE